MLDFVMRTTGADGASTHSDFIVKRRARRYDLSSRFGCGHVSGSRAARIDPGPPSRAARGYPGAWRRLWPDQRGATAVLAAISMPIMLAIAGLGIDAGWWYTIKRQNQSAADAAAVSAAYEVAANLTDVTNNLTPAAKQAATQNGWVNDANPPAGLTPIAVTYPCCAGTFAAGGIQVVLQQQQSSWLANFATLANVTISNRAVAFVS